ncbi:MAG: hypothetical protein ACU85V_09130 [Gammaproteobacteria bacterium]
MAKQLKRKARGERPYFFDDPSVDKVVAMVMGLAGETAVLHDRLDTIERLLESRGLLKRREIEQYRPSDDVMAERAAWREAFLGEILRILEIELEAAASGDTAPYDSAIETVEQDRKPRAQKKPARRAGRKQAAA